MDLISVNFPPAWHWGAFALLVPLLAWAAATAPWRRYESSALAHVWCGAIFSLTLLWSIKASIGSAFTFHLLGVSLLTLLVGARLALPSVAAVVAIVTDLRDGVWANFALNVLVMGAVPVLITTVTRKLAERHLPPNLFIYLFIVAYFGSGVAMFAAGLAASAAVVLGAGQPTTVVFDQYLPYFVYLGFGEATITGMLVTLFVVYQPAWVASFDDARYLRQR